MDKEFKNIIILLRIITFLSIIIGLALIVISTVLYGLHGDVEDINNTISNGETEKRIKGIEQEVNYMSGYLYELKEFLAESDIIVEEY